MDNSRCDIDEHLFVWKKRENGNENGEKSFHKFFTTVTFALTHKTSNEKHKNK
jgi:hypothetical protein